MPSGMKATQFQRNCMEQTNLIPRLAPGYYPPPDFQPWRATNSPITQQSTLEQQRKPSPEMELGQMSLQSSKI